MDRVAAPARRLVRAVLVGRDAHDAAAEHLPDHALEPLADATLSGLPAHRADARAELAVLLAQAHEGLRATLDRLQARMADPVEVALATVFAAAVRAAWARLQADLDDVAGRGHWLAVARDADARQDEAETFTKDSRGAAPSAVWAAGELRTWLHRVRLELARLEDRITFAASGIPHGDRWQAAGLGPEVAGVWDAWGFEPAETVAWRCVGAHDAEDAAGWRSAGFGPVDAITWRDAGFGADTARPWRRAGFDATMATAVRGRDPAATPAACLESVLLAWLQSGSIELSAVVASGLGQAARAVIALRAKAGRERANEAVHALAKLVDRLVRASGAGRRDRLGAARVLLAVLPLTAPRLKARLLLAEDTVEGAEEVITTLHTCGDPQAVVLCARANLVRAREGRTGGLLAAVADARAGERVAEAAGDPRRWAESRACLGLALALRAEADGEPGGAALEAPLRDAVRLLRRDTSPELWAEARLILGDLLVRSAAADRVRRLTEAVSLLSGALEAFSSTDTPQAFGRAHLALGQAVHDLPAAHRAESLTEAVAHYRAARRTLTGDRWIEARRALDARLAAAQDELGAG